jgi:predicted dehydrogenase
MMSGGQTVEQAVHVLDLARLLVGEVSMVHAVPAESPVDGEIDHATAAVMRFTDGATGLLATTCLLRHKHRVGLEVHAEGIALDLSETELVVDGDRQVQDGGKAKTMVDRTFVDAVQGREADVRAPYREALKTHRLALALARSARQREPVMLDG